MSMFRSISLFVSLATLLATMAGCAQPGSQASTSDSSVGTSDLYTRSGCIRRAVARGHPASQADYWCATHQEGRID